MKISIWGQFSSNHSADFDIIGVFETVEQARDARRVLIDELVKIAVWFEDPANRQLFVENYRQWVDTGTRDPLPPEQALHDRYDTGFSVLPTDWLWHSDEAEQAVTRFEHIVFLSSDISSRQTESGGEPFEKLVVALGGQIGCECLVMTCDAPDIRTAKLLYSWITERAAASPSHLLNLKPANFGNTEPDSQHLKIVFHNDYYRFSAKLKKLRELLTEAGCTNIRYKAYQDCEDVE